MSMDSSPEIPPMSIIHAPRWKNLSFRGIPIISLTLQTRKIYLLNCINLSALINMYHGDSKAIDTNKRCTNEDEMERCLSDLAVSPLFEKRANL